MKEVKAGRKMLAATLMLMIVIARTDAFNQGSVPKPSSSTLVNDEHRREFLSMLLLTTTVAVKPSNANAESAQQNTKQTINGINDPQLRDYHNSLLPNWQGTSLPGPLSLSEAHSHITSTTVNVNSEPVLTMGKWPDPILRHPSSPIPSSVFQNKNNLEQLQLVARALKNTARNEGAVGLAAQQCGVNASLLFIDGVTIDTSTNGRSWNVFGGTATNGGVFGQSSWRKSQKEISGEGTHHDDDNDFPTPNKWPRIQDQQSQPQQEKGIFLVNPRIIHRSPESEMLVWTEECLVLPPEFRATLLRDAEVTIEYESLECLDGSSGVGSSCGATKQITLQGELARCTQHEMDHDRGTLIVDHVSLDELLSIDGNSFMANIENADGLHPMRMQRAYAREVRDSTLLPSDEKFVHLAMEDNLGYCTRVKQVENNHVYEDRKRPWFVPSANAIDQGDILSSKPTTATPGPPNDIRGNPSQSVVTNNNANSSPECDDSCLDERKRIVEQRRAMMKQARSSTRRADVLELSEQRATLYGTEFKGLPSKNCSQPGFCL